MVVISLWEDDRKEANQCLCLSADWGLRAVLAVRRPPSVCALFQLTLSASVEEAVNRHRMNIPPFTSILTDPSEVMELEVSLLASRSGDSVMQTLSLTLICLLSEGRIDL